MTKRMIDAEMIDTVSNDGFDIIAVYGSSLGSPQGPARATPGSWIRNQSKPLWCIYFPGCDPASAYLEAISYRAVGVIIDLESRFEGDAWSRTECANFGLYMKAKNMPVVLYCHKEKVGGLATSFDGQWWPGVPFNTQFGPREAIQWEYAGSYDGSYCGDWFANPSQSQPQPTQGSYKMLIINSPAGQWFWNGANVYIHIPAGTDVAALEAIGIHAVAVSQGFHDALVAATTSAH